MVGFDAMFETASVEQRVVGVSVAVKPNDSMGVETHDSTIMAFREVTKPCFTARPGVQPVVILKLQLLHYALVEVPQLAVHC